MDPLDDFGTAATAMSMREGSEKKSVLKRGSERAATRKTTIVNNNRVKKNLQPKTLQNYKSDMDLWAEDGRFNIKEPSMQSVHQHWKNLTAGMRRDGCSVEPEVVNSTSEWIKGELRIELNLPRRKLKRRYGTMNHFLNLGVQLWRDDWHVYDRPGVRVELWTLIGTNVYNASPAGEYVESSARASSGRGLHFKDIVFGVFVNENDEPEFAMEVGKDGKGLTDDPDGRPRNSIDEGNPSRPFFCNMIVFFLSMFLVRGAFKDYKTLDEVLSLKPAKGEMQKLEWEKDMLDKPVFRNGDGGMQSANAYCRRLRELGKRKAYRDPPRNHDFRRENLHQIEKMCTTNQVMKQAGHKDQSTYCKHYAPQNPGTSGRAAYFGDAPRTIVNDLLRTLTITCTPDLWQSLPAEQQHELEQTPDFEKINQRLTDLSLLDDAAQARKQRAKILLKRKKLVNTALEKFQQEQSSVSKKDAATSHHYTLFSRTSHLMPPRRSLATSLFASGSIRSEECRAVIEDLMALYGSETEVPYRPGLETCRCYEGSDDKTKPTAKEWQHVYTCRRDQDPSGEFCFFCNKWFDNEADWPDHCRWHLQDPELVPVYCNPRNHGGGLANPGLCLWCLGDETLKPKDRMRQYPYADKWRTHVKRHINALEDGKTQQCPHPRGRCSRDFDTKQELIWHLQDVHCWIREGTPRSTKARQPAEEENLVQAGIKRRFSDSKAEGIPAHVKKARKNDSAEMFRFVEVRLAIRRRQSRSAASSTPSLASKPSTASTPSLASRPSSTPQPTSPTTSSCPTTPPPAPELAIDPLLLASDALGQKLGVQLAVYDDQKQAGLLDAASTFALQPSLDLGATAGYGVEVMQGAAQVSPVGVR